MPHSPQPYMHKILKLKLSHYHHISTLTFIVKGMRTIKMNNDKIDLSLNPSIKHTNQNKTIRS
jgi:hypothetical protein